VSLKEVHMTDLRQRMLEELQRRNYSPSTIRGYILTVKQFAEYFGKPPDRLGATHVKRFQWYLLQERKLDPGTVEMRRSALRFFFKKMLKRRDMHFDDLPFPKTPRKLPTVLSPEEVRRMIEGTTNLMHRTLLMVLYGTGVRRTELSLLKVADIDSKRMVIHIRQGKGARDRDVPLSPKLLEALREYWLWKKPRSIYFQVPKVIVVRKRPCRTRSSGGPYGRRLAGPASRARLVRTPFDTHSPRSCWRPERIFEPSSS
jgi:integrase/recombinase XerD